MNELSNNQSLNVLNNNYIIDKIKTIEECKRALDIEFKKKEYFENKGVVLVDKNEEPTMNHIEVCELINKFRKMEGNRKELDKSDLLKKIKKEVKTMEELNLGTDGNFSVSEYKDKSGKKNPTFLMNRNGILQICTSESVFVRVKVIEYINTLENRLKELSTPSYMIHDDRKRYEAYGRELDRKDYKECLSNIKLLEEKLEKLIIIDDRLSFEQFNRVANAIIKEIAKFTGKQIFDVWNNIYKFLEDKYGIRLATRQKNKWDKLNKDRIEQYGKPYSESTLRTKCSKLSTLKSDEYQDVIEIIKAYAIDLGINGERLLNVTKLK